MGDVGDLAKPDRSAVDLAAAFSRTMDELEDLLREHPSAPEGT